MVINIATVAHRDRGQMADPRPHASRGAIRSGAPIISAGGWCSGSSALTHPKWFQGSPDDARCSCARWAPRSGRDAMIGDIEVGALDLLDDRRRARASAARSSSTTPASRATSSSSARSTIGADAYIGTSCVHRGGRRDRRRRRTAATSPRSRPDVASAPARSGTARRRRKIGTVDPAEPRRRRPTRLAARARCSGVVYVACLLVIPPLGPAADLPGLLGVRPARRLDVGAGRRPLRLSGVAAAAGLADRPSCWCSSRSRFIAAVRWIVLPRVRGRALFGPFLVLSAQMDRGARDRDHARHAELAVRHRSTCAPGIG